MLPRAATLARSEPQMPLSEGRTRAQEEFGSRGSGTSVNLRNAPGPVTIRGNRPPISRTHAYRATLFLYCSASIRRLCPGLDSSARTWGPASTSQDGPERHSRPVLGPHRGVSGPLRDLPDQQRGRFEMTLHPFALDGGRLSIGAPWEGCQREAVRHHLARRRLGPDMGKTSMSCTALARARYSEAAGGSPTGR